MKNTLKLIAITLLLTTFGCSSDDEVNYEITTVDFVESIDENPTNGDVLGTVEATGNGTLSYSITSQNPTGALALNTTTGELTVADATLFDFETNPAITANVSVSNSENTETILVTISLNNANELNAEDFDVTIDENPTDGQVLGTVQATGDGTLSYSITSQTPANALAINASTGELTVADPNLFDFETNPVLTADILVDNSVNTETLMATITLNDLDEASAQDLSATIDENPTNGQVVGTIQASGGNLTYTITLQNPAGAFNINANTGELTVADTALFDFETNPNMLATVSVENSVNMASINANIDLNNINEIGDVAHGGIIFWIDPASSNSSGLVCALTSPAISGTWGCTGTTTGATGTAIGTGNTNTNAIVSTGCVTSGSVIEAISNLDLNGYNDWFLPSEGELIEMYANITIVNAAISANGGSVTHQFHWSSTEINTTAAKLVNLTTGFVGGNGKDGNLYFARAVRAWSDF